MLNVCAREAKDERGSRVTQFMCMCFSKLVIVIADDRLYIGYILSGTNTRMLKGVTATLTRPPDLQSTVRYAHPRHRGSVAAATQRGFCIEQDANLNTRHGLKDSVQGSDVRLTTHTGDLFQILGWGAARASCHVESCEGWCEGLECGGSVYNGRSVDQERWVCPP
ncbi:hypothetical protein BDN71DRAFT_1540701, partial [Pleurotus eryngii]